MPADRIAWADAALSRFAELDRRGLAGDRGSALAAARLVADLGEPPSWDEIERWRQRLVAERQQAAG